MTRQARRHGGESFERFYLRQVAISEGCGCAELVIRRETSKPRVQDAAGDGRSRGSFWRRLALGLRGRSNSESEDGDS
ncbi:MAG: hypothetical protein ACFCUQ_10715 [Kiloniellales bacterium]